jgi:hypothetical protein
MSHRDHLPFCPLISVPSSLSPHPKNRTYMDAKPHFGLAYANRFAAGTGPAVTEEDDLSSRDRCVQALDG